MPNCCSWDMSPGLLFSVLYSDKRSKTACLVLWICVSHMVLKGMDVHERWSQRFSSTSSLESSHHFGAGFLQVMLEVN